MTVHLDVLSIERVSQFRILNIFIAVKCSIKSSFEYYRVRLDHPIELSPEATTFGMPQPVSRDMTKAVHVTHGLSKCKNGE